MRCADRVMDGLNFGVQLPVGLRQKNSTYKSSPRGLLFYHALALDDKNWYDVSRTEVLI